MKTLTTARLTAFCETTEAQQQRINAKGLRMLRAFHILEIQKTRKREMEHVHVVRRKRSFHLSDPTQLMLSFVKFTDHISSGLPSQGVLVR